MNPASHPSIAPSKAIPRTCAWPRGAVAGVLISATLAIVAATKLFDEPVWQGTSQPGGRGRTEEMQATVAGRNAIPIQGIVSSSLQRRIEATIDRLYDFGIRRLVVCLSPDKAKWMKRAPADDVLHEAHVTVVRCGDGSGGAIAAAAAAIAANPQAVIFDGTTSEATVFIEDLRARGSFAMVVLTPSVDPQLLARSLTPGAKVWLAVTDDAPRRSSDADDASRVRIGLLTATGAILTR